MNPRLRAKAIFNKHFYLLKGLDKETIKDCAVKYVQGIRKELSWGKQSNTWHNDLFETYTKEQRLEYFKEVEKEICKL